MPKQQEAGEDLETSVGEASAGTDIGRLLDFGSWGAMQKAIVALSALAIIFDGMDIQMMGFAIPAIAKDWGVPRGDFASILGLGLFGVSVGTAVGGLLGDRIGRRAALIGNVALFGAATLAIAFAHTLTTLLILRLIAGAGIGGALPNATTLTAEFTPLQKRPVAVTLAIVCIPLGGVLAGTISARVLSVGNWRELFWIGGASPMVLTLVLFFLLPESPRFLARKPARREELMRLLKRMGKVVPADTTFVEPISRKGDGGGIMAALFGKGQLWNTLPLWSAFLLCLITVYLVFNWLPSLLTGDGLSIKLASEGLAAYNFGGVFGALLFAWWISRQGSRIPLLVGAAGGAVTALLLRAMDIGPGGDQTLLLAGLAAHGLFVNAVQTLLYALAAHVYVTRVRATGVAAALVVGRMGAILSAFFGASVLKIGHQNYFLILALGMAGVFVALTVLRKHIEKVAEPLVAG
jgi:AAHS family 4-hydroxybenzoate transporter-like MFS transporter